MARKGPDPRSSLAAGFSEHGRIAFLAAQSAWKRFGKMTPENEQAFRAFVDAEILRLRGEATGQLPLTETTDAETQAPSADTDRADTDV